MARQVPEEVRVDIGNVWDVVPVDGLGKRRGDKGGGRRRSLRTSARHGNDGQAKAIPGRRKPHEESKRLEVEVEVCGWRWTLEVDVGDGRWMLEVGGGRWMLEVKGVVGSGGDVWRWRRWLDVDFVRGG